MSIYTHDVRCLRRTHPRAALQMTSGVIIWYKRFDSALATYLLAVSLGDIGHCALPDLRCQNQFGVVTSEDRRVASDNNDYF